MEEIIIEEKPLKSLNPKDLINVLKIWFSIFMFLQPGDLLALCSTCKDFRLWVSYDEVWEYALRRMPRIIGKWKKIKNSLIFDFVLPVLKDIDSTVKRKVKQISPKFFKMCGICGESYYNHEFSDNIDQQFCNLGVYCCQSCFPKSFLSVKFLKEKCCFKDEELSILKFIDTREGHYVFKEDLFDFIPDSVIRYYGYLVRCDDKKKWIYKTFGMKAFYPFYKNIRKVVDGYIDTDGFMDKDSVQRFLEEEFEEISKFKSARRKATEEIIEEIIEETTERKSKKQHVGRVSKKQRTE